MKLSKKTLKTLGSILIVIGGILVYFTTDSEIKPQQDSFQGNMERTIVERVVDGDTLKINSGNGEDTVRLIGINTPETVDPRTTVECFGKEAAEKMKSLAEGQEVLVVKDPTQGERDKYNRLLAYVYLTDGTLLNQKMIADGYAFEYTYNLPYEFQIEFKDAEKAAQEQALGLWNKSKCDYISNLK